MKRIILVALIAVINISCLGYKSVSMEPSIYEMIISDIKADSVFDKFSEEQNIQCENFNVSSQSLSLCAFELHAFLEINSKDLQKLYKENCKGFDFNSYESARKDLDTYSDEGDSCLSIWFSEIINDKIIIEIKNNKSSDQIGFDILNYIYSIKNNTVIKEDTFGATIN